MSAMRGYALSILVIGWLLWVLPFVLKKGTGAPAKKVDQRARWGILLAALAYSLLFQGRFWERPLPGWRIAASILLYSTAALLSWTGMRALGAQWRIDAALGYDHQLITAGPYRLVRHPIYASMLCVLWAAGMLVSSLPMLLLATGVLILGTEIRVRLEEKLLASQFGDQFRDYQSRVSAYIPFIR
jgi:protein-S-isoprenylcysteine O-methyltransferase Ste14